MLMKADFSRMLVAYKCILGKKNLRKYKIFEDNLDVNANSCELKIRKLQSWPWEISEV